MRGAVKDRPFGKTLGYLARRKLTVEVSVEGDGGLYAIVLQHGHLVAATSPEIEEIGISEVGADALRARRRAIARHAARMIALEHGEFRVSSTLSLPVVPGCEMHIGGVIYQAAQAYLAPRRLHAIIEELGYRFELRHDVIEDLPYFGFGARERPFLHALLSGVSLDALQTIISEPERRVAQASVYALAACGALYCEMTPPPRLARGTKNPIADTIVEMATEPLTKSTAAEAFDRAQCALRSERIADALSDLELANQLAPNDPQYQAAYAWARFCAATDKPLVANETRKALARAIAKCDQPVMPTYYLGLVERMLGRREQAIEYFREVLELDPRHTDAATELRFLARRN